MFMYQHTLDYSTDWAHDSKTQFNIHFKLVTSASLILFKELKGNLPVFLFTAPYQTWMKLSDVKQLTTIQMYNVILHKL